MSVPDELEELAERLGHRFRDSAILDVALTHGSASCDGTVSNARLEFLGDAVLAAVVCEALYQQFPQASEGRLTILKSDLVNNERLAAAAREANLGRYLRLGKGLEAKQGRGTTSILADAFEAVLGAVYLDGGMPAARKVVEKTLFEERDLSDSKFDPAASNPKSALQEWLAARSLERSEYVLISAEGPSDRRTFRVRVICGSYSAMGEAHTKQGAEKIGARRVLEQLIASEASGSKPQAATG